MRSPILRRLGAGLAAAAFFALAGILWAGSQEAREDAPPAWESVTSNDDTYRVRYALEPATIEFGELFSVEVQAERADGEAFDAILSVDARMPEHFHGMNREPQVEVLGDGRFAVTNLYFHMPGYWEIYFDFTRGAITERAQFPVDVD